MKVLIISKPRARSTLFREVVGKYHQFDDLTYDDLRDKLPKREWWNLEGEDYPEYIQAMKNRTSEWTDNYLVKLEFQNLCHFSYSRKLLDFDIFDFERYDRIYLLSRKNSKDNIASFFVSDQLDKWFNLSKEDLKNIKTKIDPNLENPDKSAWPIIQSIWTDIVLQKIINYFTEKNIKFTLLDYDEIPNYIDINFPGVKTMARDKNFNYSDILEDYNKIDDYIEKLTPVAHKLFLEQNNGTTI